MTANQSFVDIQSVPFVNGLSKQLWNIDWKQELSHDLINDRFKFCVGNRELLDLFMNKHKDKIFYQSERESPFFNRSISPHKKQYLEYVSDIFLIYDNRDIVGVFVSDPTDWSSYYLRYINILPECRGEKLCELCCQRLFPILEKHNIERVSCDISPIHKAQIHRMTNLGFVITGTFQSERWGVLLQFTKFFNQETEQNFSKNFCLGPNYSKPKVIK